MVHQVIRNKRQGKAVQKKVVESFGGKNIGTLGGEDGEHPIWSIEVKSCVRFAGEKFMKQCESNCKPGKTPLLIVHTKNMRHPEDLVVMRRRDWDQWFGRLDTKGEPCSKQSQDTTFSPTKKRLLRFTKE